MRARVDVEDVQRYHRAALAKSALRRSLPRHARESFSQSVSLRSHWLLRRASRSAVVCKQPRQMIVAQHHGALTVRVNKGSPRRQPLLRVSVRVISRSCSGAMAATFALKVLGAALRCHPQNAAHATQTQTQVSVAIVSEVR